MLLPIDSSISSFTVATLPNPAALATGTSFAITDYGGNIATAVGGQWRFEFPFRTTWANRPPVNLVPVGAELQATDYASQKWICDGTVWRSAQGVVSIGQQYGKASAPLATLTGTTAGYFAIPGGNPLIKAGMIVPNSRVYAETFIRKDGTGGTAGFYARLALVGASWPDATFATSTINNGDKQCARYFASAKFGTSRTQFFTEQYVAPQAQASNAFVDKAAQINADADMEVSLAISSATVTDTFNLYGYRVWLEG